MPVPRGLSAEHVTLSRWKTTLRKSACEIRSRLRKRVVPVFSTSPPQSLPSSKETPQPMSTINEDEGDVKTEQEKDNRVVLMKTEVPGFSSKDIECFINVDRTIEAKRGDESAKIAIDQVNIDSINAYCEHGIFQVLGERVPPSSQESIVVPVASPSSDREGKNRRGVGRRGRRRRRRPRSRCRTRERGKATWHVFRIRTPHAATSCISDESAFDSCCCFALERRDIRVIVFLFIFNTKKSHERDTLYYLLIKI